MTKEAVLLQLAIYASEYRDLINRGRYQDAREYEEMGQELRELYKELLDKDNKEQE